MTDNDLGVSADAAGPAVPAGPEPAAQSQPEALVPNADEGESVLRSKARALAESVWTEHRGTALRFAHLSGEASELLVDCCLKGMCVGIVGGSELARDRVGPSPMDVLDALRGLVVAASNSPALLEDDAVWGAYSRAVNMVAAIAASGIEAPSGGETAQTGSTEGESPAPKGDAQP